MSSFSSDLEYRPASDGKVFFGGIACGCLAKGIALMKQDQLALVTAEPFNAESAPEALRAPITPVERHYVRSHFPVPQHDGILRVEGAVEHSLTLTLADLRALPAASLNVTLECAGNGRQAFRPFPGGEPFGWNAVGTATWTGVPLREVLARAAISREGNRAVVFEGADHGPFQNGPDIHFARALSPAYIERWGENILLAYAMNEEPLTPNHGAPVRLIVPGWYAMASVKWLKRISVVDAPYDGEFQTHSYIYYWPDGTHERVTTMRVRALVTDPLPGAVLAQGAHTIRGKAWSGSGTVSEVEIDVDGEGAWQSARMAAPVGPQAWQEWSFDWVATGVGRHVITARARDSSGAAQPDLARSNALGYGNNAIQPLVVDVR